MNEIIEKDLERIFESEIINWERFRNKTVLITGASGMLASYMVFMLFYLNEKRPSYHINIVVVCRDYKKAKKRFSDYISKDYFSIITKDICENLEITEAIDFIIHAASPASSQYYNTDPVSVIKPNILGTYNTLEIAREKNVEAYLYFSSGEIYGKIEKETIDECDNGDIDSMDVRNCYGESKRMGENMCKCWQHQYGIPVKIVRPAHTYGPTLDLINDDRVFSDFVSDVLKGNDIEIKSDGSAKRSFCYIVDATIAYFKVLLDGMDGEAYNVGNKNNSISIKDLAVILLGCSRNKNAKIRMKKREDLNYLENPHKLHPVLSTKKLENLGWQCHYGIKEGFLRTIESFEKR